MRVWYMDCATGFQPVEASLSLAARTKQTTDDTMIRKERGHIVTTCDGCGEFHTDQEGVRPAFKTFRQGWTELQARGWTAKKIPKDCQHFCPDCSTVERDSQAARVHQ